VGISIVLGGSQQGVAVGVRPMPQCAGETVDDGGDRLFNHRGEPTQNGHGQDHLAIPATDVAVPQDIVGDAPEAVPDPME